MEGKRYDDEIGKKYGKLKVISVHRDKTKKITVADCVCDCGKKKTVRLSSLKNGNTTSCGCSRRKIDLTGQRFGRLTVIRENGADKRGRLWLCKCDCGNYKSVYTRLLRSGNVKSCGCGMIDHAYTALKDSEGETRVSSLYRKKVSNNTSGRIGVYWYKRKDKWSAEITFQKKRYFLGYFDEFEDACEARKVAEENVHKNFLQWYAKEHPEKAKKIEKKIKEKEEQEEKKNEGL